MTSVSATRPNGSTAAASSLVPVAQTPGNAVALRAPSAPAIHSRSGFEFSPAASAGFDGPTISPERIQAPNPQKIREGKWGSLDGNDWSFGFDDGDRFKKEGFRALGDILDRKINVPFPFEAELSGIGTNDVHPVVVYRKTFTPPKRAAGEDLLLNFQAVDYKAQVFVNGKLAGEHQGGHVPFTIDASPFVKPGEKCEVVVRAEDYNLKTQPIGKQHGKPEWIVYERTTGIWRSVSWEIAPSARISDFEIRSRSNGIDLGLELHGVPPGFKVEAELFEGPKSVGRVSTQVQDQNAALSIDVKEPKPWSFKSPSLYDLRLRVLDPAGKVVDEITSYAGLRSVDTRDGEFVWNGKPLALAIGPLDQNYRKGSNMTSASIEANATEVERLHELGYNFTRYHATTPDPRKMFELDRRGMMWSGEIPSCWEYSKEGAEAWLSELVTAIKEYRNHPSLLKVVLFNEDWGIQGLHHRDPEQMAFVDKVVDTVEALTDVPYSTNDGWNQYRTKVLGLHDYGPNGADIRERWPVAEVDDQGRKTNVIPELSWQSLPERPNLVPGEAYQGQVIAATEIFGQGQLKKGDLDIYRAASREEVLTNLEEVLGAFSDREQVKMIVVTQAADVGVETNGMMDAEHNPKFEPAEHRDMLSRVFGERADWL